MNKCSCCGSCWGRVGNIFNQRRSPVQNFIPEIIPPPPPPPIPIQTVTTPSSNTQSFQPSKAPSPSAVKDVQGKVPSYPGFYAWQQKSHEGPKESIEPKLRKSKLPNGAEEPPFSPLMNVSDQSISIYQNPEVLHAWRQSVINNH